MGAEPVFFQHAEEIWRACLQAANTTVDQTTDEFATASLDWVQEENQFSVPVPCGKLKLSDAQTRDQKP